MFDPMHTIIFFLATKTHLIKVIESNKNYEVQSSVECFPIPITHETPGSDVLYPSHRSRVAHSLRMRKCTVIHESPVNFETGKMSFTLCGLENFPSDGSTLRIMEVCLDPDGSGSLKEFVTGSSVTSFCIGLHRQHGRGVALTTDKQPLVFALDYHGPGFVSFEFSILDHRFPESEILALDVFGGTAFFFRRSSRDTFVELADFTHGAQKAVGHLVRHKRRSLGWSLISLIAGGRLPVRFMTISKKRVGFGCQLDERWTRIHISVSMC